MTLPSLAAFEPTAVNLTLKKSALEKLDAIDVATHPLRTLENIAKYFEKIQYFTLIAYDYKGEEYGLEVHDSESFLVSAKNVVEEGMAVMLRATEQGRDVVVDSRVYVLNPTTGLQERYIPMFDLALPSNSPGGLRKALKGNGALNFYACLGQSTVNFDIYNSGRSWHAYNPNVLLERKDWLKFMYGLLVLTPIPNDYLITADGNSWSWQYGESCPVADTRWVGHNLLNNSARLRLTCTNPHYLQVPTLAPNPAVGE